MRDRHAADVGDFGKFGLLRWLVGGDSPDLRLGVVWYYWGEDVFQYAGAQHRDGPLARCDADLYDKLAPIAMERTALVARLEHIGLLPGNTAYVGDEVPASLKRRNLWFGNAKSAVRGCDIVFLDPDNGLETENEHGRKHALYSEAAALWNASHSLVIYQHIPRTGTSQAVKATCNNLRAELEKAQPVPLVYHRGSSRAFIVIPNPASPRVCGLLRERIDAFLNSAWGTGNNPHFTIIGC